LRIAEFGLRILSNWKFAQSAVEIV